MIPTQQTILENIEEMLGAYIEGNLSEAEETAMEKILSEDSGLSELLDDACQDILNTSYGTIITAAEDMSEDDLDELEKYEFDINNLLNNNETMDEVKETLLAGIGETAGGIGETAGSVGNIDHSAATGPMQVGERPVDEYSAYVKQGYSDTCAINSQKIILDAFGKHFTEEELREQAIQNGLYREGHGTSINDMGKLLELNDCPCTNYICGNVADLTRVLAEGKMVMMAVDSGELWKEGWLGKLWEKVEDVIPGIGGADHALLVTGIDASDPENVKVIVTDPGSGDLNKPYPIEQFIDAAKDSHFFMTVTDNPKPDVFDAYDRPDMTHLPTIGGLNYHEFINTYTPYFTLGNDLEIEIPEGTFEKLVASVLGEDGHWGDIEDNDGNKEDEERIENNDERDENQEDVDEDEEKDENQEDEEKDENQEDEEKDENQEDEEKDENQKDVDEDEEKDEEKDENQEDVDEDEDGNDGEDCDID